MLVLGIAYTPNVDDIQEAPATEIILLLQQQGAHVSHHDRRVPVFPSMRRRDIELTSTPLDEQVLAQGDVVRIGTDHAAIDWALVAASATVIVDYRDAMSGCGSMIRGKLFKA